MKTLAVFLSLAICSPAYAAPAAAAPATAPVDAVEPLVIIAPHVQPPEQAARMRSLKRVRAGGEATAASGAGLITYAVFFGAAGPVGWAAGLMFAGGMTAYLSHRRIKGKDDFGPTNATVALNEPADQTLRAR